MSMRRPLRVGFDIDGVLYPFTMSANAALVAEFGIEDPGEHQHWDWLKEQITPEQWTWLWSAEGQHKTFGKVERVYPGAVEAVNTILARDHDVHFVTHRDPRRTSIHTSVFLSLHFGGFPWSGVHVLKTNVPKHDLTEWDVFVDDKPETVHSMLANTDAMVFAPQRPWNVELSMHHGDPRFIHYTDPCEIADWVLNKEAL